ncbi:hypothetical protein B0H10DRAFT_1012232 [Mycena sp. CBHHK59/15]|nr:hypothetical protein B0H10DRAFT_1012232 [Mycena sp. CBHHK59/15]
MAKVDPAAIPLPPHSPPTSALSFSSRSSLSSYATESGASQRRASDASASMRNALDGLVHLSGMDGSEGVSDEEHEEREERPGEVSPAERKVRAEAKSIRKIADLEITNRSLLAINTTLEQTKHRQAKELRELRRKLRESRLILPPRAFRAVTSADPAEATADDPDEEDDDADLDEEEEKNDAAYRRVKALLDGLLDAGRAALAATPADFPEEVKVAKVLSAYEVRDESDEEGARDDDAVRVALPDSGDGEDDGASEDDGGHSEDEVEAMTLPRDSPSPSTSPQSQSLQPILISEPA